MQRIVCRFRKDAGAGAISHSDLREAFERAAAQAHLPLKAGRAVQLGPALPPEATSDAERVFLDLTEPRDPSDLCRRLNPFLPSGLALEGCWIGRGPDDAPALLDEAVYDVQWTDAPPTDEVAARVRAFLQATEVIVERQREKKVQALNARALTRDLRVLDAHHGALRLRMTVSVGPQGSLRPDEVLVALGYAPAADTLRIHRIALQHSGWQRPTRPPRVSAWRRRGEPRP